LYLQLAKYLFSSFSTERLFTGFPQEDSKSTYSVWRDEDDYRIDWSRSSEEILHFINCLSFPYKGASTICNKKIIRIIDATIEVDVCVVNRDIGKVLFISGKNPVIICGTGLLCITLATDEKGNNILPFENFRVRLK